MEKNFEEMSLDERLERAKIALVEKREKYDEISAKLAEENQLSDRASFLNTELQKLSKEIANLEEQIKLLEREDSKAFFECLSSGKKGARRQQ